jgi:uncharacterized membrane protein YccC
MWVVLTAFLVCSGNRGRADVLHKSALRVLGAAGGTVGSVALLAVLPHASGSATVAFLFGALFVGTWLRPFSYAYWALAVTLALSLLQQLTGVATLSGEFGVLAARVLAIVVGAAIGIAASWFVLPVRSTDVLRRRLSDLLQALTGVLAPSGERAERMAEFRVAVARVEQLAPAHRAARRILGRRRALPIDCIEAAAALPAALRTRLEGPRRAGESDDRERLRAAVARARRSLAAPVDLASVRDALRALDAALRGGPSAPPAADS